MNAPHLLSTDFDGTLIGFPPDGRCVAELEAALRAWRESGGLWIVNTGRSPIHLREGLEKFDAPFAPDFVITSERHIFREAGGEWHPDSEWNEECDVKNLALAGASGREVLHILERLPRFGEFVLVQEHGAVAGVVVPDEETMVALTSALEPLRRDFPDFDWQRNAVYLRFSHREYTKGSTLARLASALGTPPSRILAVGDNHNDLAMLDGREAFPACPSNAVPEVCDLVRRAGGYVAAGAAGEGTAEAIFVFLGRLFAGEERPFGRASHG